MIGTGVRALTAAMTVRARARTPLPRAEAPLAPVRTLRLKAAAWSTAGGVIGVRVVYPAGKPGHVTIQRRSAEGPSVRGPWRRPAIYPLVSAATDGVMGWRTVVVVIALVPPRRLVRAVVASLHALGQAGPARRMQDHT